MKKNRLASLLQMGELLAPHARKLAAEVTLAWQDAPAYAKKHARRLDDYVVDIARSPNLPWFALIDALAEARACASLDWKDGRDEVAGKVGRLRAAPRGAFGWMKKDAALEERSTWELLELTAQHLRERGLQLANLDTNSDRYCLVLVPLAAVKKVGRLAEAAGYGHLEPFGDELGAATRERLARHKREERARARVRKRPPPDNAHYQRGHELRLFGVDKNGYSYFVTGPKLRRSVGHSFPDKAAARRGADEEIAAWLAEGFRRLSDAESAALPDLGLWDLLCVAELPEGARYFVRDGRVVSAIELRGDTVWSSSGLIGGQFGQIEHLRHCGSPESAQRIFQRELTQRTSGDQPIERRALLKRFRSTA